MLIIRHNSFSTAFFGVLITILTLDIALFFQIVIVPQDFLMHVF